MIEGIDPELEEFGRQRLLQLCEWREILVHGSDEERRTLVASLREIDFLPLISTLDADEADVRKTASVQRRALAFTELQRMMEEAAAAGDFDTAAQWLDLKLSAD